MARSIFFYTDSRVLGGAENAMFMLLQSLDREAWNPTLLLDDAPDAEALAERAAALSVPVRRIGPLPLGLAGARRAPALARLLRRERPAVFHAHMSSPVACKFGLAAAVLARVPAVVGTVQVGAYEPPDRAAYWQLRCLAHGVDRFIAVSGEIAAELTERLGWPADKVTVVHNAVDLGRFDTPAPPRLREELGIEMGVPLVLTAARLDRQKGHPTLLEAAARTPKAVFLLAGEGPERGRLEALAARLGVADRVRFLGRRDDVPDLLAACDLFVLPSLYEGSSLAVLEAMAARRAVLSSAIGGTEELIEDGREGILVPPGDVAALARELGRLLADASLRQELGARARARVERDLARERMAQRVAGVYEEVLGAGLAAASTLPESRRNALLRREDWRFLMPAAGLAGRRWLPLPSGPRRLRRRFESADFSEVQVYWPGPIPHRQPQFWLPVESSAAVEHLLASRPPDSLVGRALRGVWRVAWRAGLLVPLYAVGRPSGVNAEDVDGLPSLAPLLLLTGGHRSINKAVGLAFEAGEGAPVAAVKFARVGEAEPGLEREAAVLRRLGAERPDLSAIPRLRGEGRRGGLLAIAEDAVEGTPLLKLLTEADFGELARSASAALVDLVDTRRGQPLGWRERLLSEPLDRFEREFGAVVGPAAIATARVAIEGLGEQFIACEHRDCSPWNLLRTPSGELCLLDWESSEPDGLPAMDLVYFLANCAFVLDGALEGGGIRDSYDRLLDPSTPHGRIAAEALGGYADALGIEAADLSRLRLLCWLVHSHSDYHHLRLEDRREPPLRALRNAPFLGLVEAELEAGSRG